MNVQHYKQRLLNFEKTLSARTGRAVAEARGQFIDVAHDVGEASAADEVASEQFTEAGQSSAILQQVRDALTRVDAGTFGRCIVDDGPIEQKRLDAMPWTAYCLKHEQLREAAAPSSTPIGKGFLRSREGPSASWEGATDGSRSAGEDS